MVVEFLKSLDTLQKKQSFPSRRIVRPGEPSESILQDVFVGGNLTFHGGATPWWSFERFETDNENDQDDCKHEGGPMAVAVSEEVPGNP
jgi:hypothetical protein